MLQYGISPHLQSGLLILLLNAILFSALYPLWRPPYPDRTLMTFYFQFWLAISHQDPYSNMSSGLSKGLAFVAHVLDRLDIGLNVAAIAYALERLDIAIMCCSNVVCGKFHCVAGMSQYLLRCRYFNIGSFHCWGTTTSYPGVQIFSSRKSGKKQKLMYQQ